jgi:peptidoglycan/LPS O-acetylase OafA/YrhL
MVIAVIAASWVSWRFVEMPALAWFRRLSKRI